MNPKQENFESLRRLMKLKRYEQPPPRYFRDFSSQVIARISKEQTETSPVSSWLERLSGIFQARPALSGVLGASVCVLLLGTAVYSDQGVAAQGTFINTPTAGLPPEGEHVTMVASGVYSTNPVVHMPGSLFDQIKVGPALPAGFRY